MRIIGFKLTKILGEKLKEPEESSINLNSNFNLGEVKKEENQLDPNEVVFSIEFTNSYTFDVVAKIEFKGNVFFTINKGDENTLKDVEKTKKIKDVELRKRIIDYIFRKIHVDSLSLEEKLSLPFHIQPPQVNINTGPDQSED